MKPKLDGIYTDYVNIDVMLSGNSTSGYSMESYGLRDAFKEIYGLKGENHWEEYTSKYELIAPCNLLLWKEE